MWKILIADDEPLIVSGLSERIDWAALGCQVVSTAENGLEARRLLETLTPDILLTDIVMPGLSGLELAEIIRAEHRHTEVILLSTYDHFEYAREGLRIGVCDYILKPIDIARLQEAVRKAIERLPSSQGQQSSRSEGELLFETALYGPAALRGQEVSGLRTLILCVRAFDRREENAYDVMAALRDALRASLEASGVRVHARMAGETLVFLCVTEGQADTRRVRESLEEAIRAIPPEAALCVAAMGPAPVPPEDLHSQYAQCARTAAQGYFAREPGIISEKVSGSGPNIQPMPEEIAESLSQGRMEALEEAFHHLCGDLASAADSEQAQYALRELYRMATNTASRLGMAEKPVQPERLHDESFARSCHSAWEYLRTICAWASQRLSLAGRLRLAVEENFTRPEFGLAEAAEMLDMSPAYLSRVFKRETGENFQEMLTRVRIEKASALLRGTDLKVGEIARQVGFDNERYFGQVFRRHTQRTPVIYRMEQKAK